MTPNVFITVDPGVMTGICAFWPSVKLCQVGIELKDWAAVRYVEDILALNPNALVISEKFFITMNTVKMSRQDASLKTNGALEYECWKRGHAYEEQSKSTAAKMGRDVELKRLGLYVPGRGHANDAARHMVLGVNRHVPELLDNEFLAGYSGDRVTIERIT